MFISILGFSFQVALFSDMIKLASLHAYCFYVYAARLYGVAVQGLVSTLRMFKGSKWNPLRQRVDSGHFSRDQLCIGMFIASSLLMLLPTILVYYIVFLLVSWMSYLVCFDYKLIEFAFSVTYYHPASTRNIGAVDLAPKFFATIFSATVADKFAHCCR